jgi:hypothetical protein
VPRDELDEPFVKLSEERVPAGGAAKVHDVR